MEAEQLTQYHRRFRTQETVSLRAAELGGSEVPNNLYIRVGAGVAPLALQQGRPLKVRHRTPGQMFSEKERVLRSKLRIWTPYQVARML